MVTTTQIYETRKVEIELCYSILVDLRLDEQPNGRTVAIDKVHTEQFAPILKSNILLMLYNLVEACVTTGFVEIYDSIKDSGLAYTDMIESIRKIWANFMIRDATAATAKTQTYEQNIQTIIAKVISGASIELTKDAIGIGGNLDAKAIRKLLDNHAININDRADKFHMLLVKTKRNNLAHGIDSFGESARDISISQLKDIKDEVLNFISTVINCMKSYYEGREYCVRT